ncbi:hypothetical protein CH267_00755 [Rhodococcus sp. 06-621-2]|nr:hypothetical protein CH267_00755 [Rhodococcus sp. 06-621-2]
MPRWVYDRAPQAPTILQHWDGLPSITLSKVASGARLLWVFEEDFPEQLGAFVHLTDDEAQHVFESPSDDGLIEAVRTRLRDRTAYVWRKSGSSFGAAEFRIPKRGTEEQFAAALWQAAESVPHMIDLAEFSGSHRAPRGMAEVVAAARDNTLLASSGGSK